MLWTDQCAGMAAMLEGAQAFRTVAEHRHAPMGAGLDNGGHIGGLAVEVDRHDHPGQPATPGGAGEFAAQKVHIHRPGIGRDVEEAGCRAHLHGGADGGDEGERAGPDLIARADTEQLEAQMQRRGAGGDGGHMLHADGARDGLLKGCGNRPGGGDPAGIEHGLQRIQLTTREMRW